MFLFLKKKSEEDRPEGAGPEPTPLNEFIPYFGHFAAQTILTKNGELMQTIKITANAQGLNYESGDQTAVREMLRAVIADTIDSEKFALWIHAVRKRRRVHYDVKFKEPFAAAAHERWQHKHHWKHQYDNEIYVSLLHEGQKVGLFDKEGVKRGLLSGPNRRYRQHYLDDAATALDRMTSAIIAKLRTAYDARLLSLAERDGVFYSEPMEFLGRLVNLRADSFALDEADMSQQLAASKLTFGFNALESRSSSGRRFGALMSMKQYCEIPTETVDHVLQLPMELIVSESFSFVPAARALKSYKEQKELFDISGDSESLAASGLEEILASDHGRAVDFGEHQISIMPLADDYRHLDSEVAKIQEGFSEAGIIIIREDIMLEECFWAQLPGNFEFLRRKSAINTARIGGFSRLNRFASGSPTNPWGPAVALVQTTVHSPYFFNFHHGDNGHTALFDFNSFHDHMGSTLLNFLLTETRKYDGRLYVFDRGQSAQLLLEKLGGRYGGFPSLVVNEHGVQASPSSSVPPLKLNPFELEDSPRNRGFLLAWCLSLMAPFVPSDAQKDLIRAAIDQIYSGAPEQRNFSALVAKLSTDPALAKAVASWHSGGKHAGIFDGADGFDPLLLLHGFDMNPVARRPETVVPVFAYLLHRIITALDGRPTIIVLHKAWDVLENDFIAPRLESLLEMLKQHNAIVIFTTEQPLEHVARQTFATVMKNCATHLYVPADVHGSYVNAALEITESDEQLLKRMDRQKGELLVKQAHESTGMRIDLHGLDDIGAVFAGDSKNLTTGDGKWK